MKKRNRLCRIELAILALTAAFFGCRPPATAAFPVVTVTSPESKYYTALPASIDYSLSEPCPTVTVSLNGIVVDPEDGLAGPVGSVTGLNILTVSATNAAGRTAVDRVVYFYNDLPISDTDDFERADSPGVGNGWTETDAEGIMEIQSGGLICRGTVGGWAYPNLAKAYDGAVKRKILQTMDILSLTHDAPAEAILVLRDAVQPNASDPFIIQVAAHFVSDTGAGGFLGHRLYLSDWRRNRDDSIHYEEFASTASVDLNPAGPVTLVFLCDDDDFSAVLCDAGGDILFYVKGDDHQYPDGDSSRFTNYCMQLETNGFANPAEIFVAADNFTMY